MALGRVCGYAQWRRRAMLPAREPEEPSDHPVIREIVDSKQAGSPEGGWLELDQATRLLTACGLPVLPAQPAASAAEAAAAAAAAGFPVALKARAGDLVHKSDVGGVALGLNDPGAVRAAYQMMQARPGAQTGGAVVQPIAAPGIEAIAGLATDPEFGPVVMAGLGEIMTDLLRDREFAVPPLDPGAADAMVTSLRAAPLLDGYRGAPKADRQPLVTLIETVARVAEEIPELAEPTSTRSWSVPAGHSPWTVKHGSLRAPRVPARRSPHYAADRKPDQRRPTQNSRSRTPSTGRAGRRAGRRPVTRTSRLIRSSVTASDSLSAALSSCSRTFPACGVPTRPPVLTWDSMRPARTR